jgi:hypothetical protein
MMHGQQNIKFLRAISPSVTDRYETKHSDGRGLGEYYGITNHVFNNIFSDYQRLIICHTSELQKRAGTL